MKSVMYFCCIIINQLIKNIMATEKQYKFIFIDIFGNDTEEKIYQFANYKEAKMHAKNLLANANDNTEEIIVKLLKF